MPNKKATHMRITPDLDGDVWIVSEFCHCIEITRYPAPGVGESFCPETPRDFDFDL